jgi:hypothetical protein
MALSSFIISIWAALTALIKYFGWIEMQNIMGSTMFWFGIVLFIIILYFAVTLLILGIARKKHKKAVDNGEEVEFG